MERLFINFFLKPARRYSEDIDLVQLEPNPIGGILDSLRHKLDPWLGEPRRKRGPGRVTLLYRFESEIEPLTKLRLKIEINTREHFSVLGIQPRMFEINSPWFQGQAQLPAYQLEELLGTKMRALYQRKKGRDLYDLWLALKNKDLKTEDVIKCFLNYMKHGGTSVRRSEYETNLLEKIDDAVFREDILPLLIPGTSYSAKEAMVMVQKELISKLPD